IIAPVVMITACAITLGALQSRYAAINDRLRLMTRERLDLLRSLGVPIVPVMPAGDAAQRGSDAYAEERLTEIDVQIPLLLRRHRLAHGAVLAVYYAMIAFIGNMFVIAVAVATSAAAAATAALIVFLLAMAIFLAGVMLIAEEVRASHRTIQYEVERVLRLGPHTTR
ncbi:MAG: DUF2721 domain-containing protein, partial [Luteimonas sp.]|nr:DUF2721 domain-containing protein [Luteimonas sp.]